MAAETGLDPNAKGPDGLPILFWTLQQENLPKVEALLDAGADIEAKGYNGATPLLSQAIVQDWIAVELLMKRGARLDVADRVGFTVPYLLAHAKVAKGSRNEAAMAAVRQVMNDRGLLGRIHEPAEVRALMAAGKWPPQ